MKRPIPVYFVAAWCFLGLGQQASPLSKRLMSAPSEGQGWGQSLLLLAYIAIIWHTVRLVQLKLLNVWLSIVFFVVWTLVMAWNTFALLQRFSDPTRAIALVSVFGAFNVASLWYLARPSFRRFAAEFVAERDAGKKPPATQAAASGKDRDHPER
jgi:hypothetical protein